jgi:histidyl-tRNA synthetase
LRNAEIKSEIYPEPVKIKKQMKYANDKQIPFVIVIGSEEIKSGKLALKNMQEGTQEMLSTDEIINFLK